jgi:hypothetical protein
VAGERGAVGEVAAGTGLADDEERVGVHA